MKVYAANTSEGRVVALYVDQGDAVRGIPADGWVEELFVIEPMNMAEWRIDIDGVLDAKGKAPLSLNSRMHWGTYATRVARIKAVVRNAVLTAGIGHLDHVHIEMHYRPATNRFRDIDNLVATMKPAVDALHQHDTSENAPVPYEPIVDGDDPRYVTLTWPVLHPCEKGRPPALWLILRSTG